MSSTDTIVAVSSPPGASWRGLVRGSGPDAAAVFRALVGGEALPPSHHLVTGRLRLGDTTLPVLAAFFAGPGTYTGQDMFELQCPGHPALLDRILHAAIAHGARLAEPGEFTFRAFLAGRLDLTQAEGVAATISATSDAQLAAANQLRRGQLGRFASDLVDQLATALALVEAGIDFVDQEDVVAITPADLHERLTHLHDALRDLLRHSRSWGALEGLPRVVLVGVPSAGKSTLFNALLGRVRAVTSPMPGTTRDVLAEPLKLHTPTGREVEVMLVDVAGLDVATSTLDADIQAAAREAIERADLLIAVDDPTQGKQGIAQVDARGVPVLRIRAKADVPIPPGVTAPPCDLAVSAQTGAGLAELRRAIAERVGERGVSISGEMLALQPRHESALRHALEQLDIARQLVQPHTDEAMLPAPELVAGAMRSALDALAGLGGQVSPDDVIGRIFATFCVGK